MDVTPVKNELFLYMYTTSNITALVWRAHVELWKNWNGALQTPINQGIHYYSTINQGIHVPPHAGTMVNAFFFSLRIKNMTFFFFLGNDMLARYRYPSFPQVKEFDSENGLEVALFSL